MKIQRPLGCHRVAGRERTPFAGGADFSSWLCVPRPVGRVMPALGAGLPPLRCLARF